MNGKRAKAIRKLARVLVHLDKELEYKPLHKRMKRAWHAVRNNNNK